MPRRVKADRRDAERGEPRLSRDPDPRTEPGSDRSPRDNWARAERSPGFERAEPSLWRAPSGAAEPNSPPQRPRLVAEENPERAWRESARRGESEYRPRHPLLWVAGGALLVAAAVFVYAHSAREPANIVGIMPPSPQASLPAAALQPVISTPQKTKIDSIAPPRAATILPPIETPPDQAKPGIAALRPPAAPAAKPAPTVAHDAAAAPKLAPATAVPTPPATRPSALAATPMPKRVVLPLASPPAALTAQTGDEDPAKSAPGDHGSEATVSVDGTNFVIGREPHSLGNLTTHAELASAPAHTAPAPPPASAPAATDKLRGDPLPPNTEFAITPGGVMAPSGVVTPFGRQ